MSKITNFINNLTIEQIVDIWIAIAIILFFQIFKSGLSYIVIRLFKVKEKDPKKIKNSAFFIPLKAFFSVLGVYIALLFLREPINISQELINLMSKIFKIIVIITTSTGIAKSMTPKSSFAKKFIKNNEKELDDSVLNFILKIVRGIIYVIGAFLVITELGYNLNGLVAGLGLGGVIFTLAAQDTAKNLFGGLVIFLDKPFKVGDWIEVGKYEGTVEDMTFRSTRIRVFENALVNIPNSIVAESSIINWSRMEKRRYKINLVLELDTPLEKVEKIKSEIHKMLENRDAVMDDTILVKFDEITDNGIDILVYAYTECIDYPSFLSAKENINYKIMQILKKEDVELAYNTQTIQIKN